MPKKNHSLAHMQFTCPRCQQAVSGDHTPIQSIYEQILKLDLYCSSKDLEDFSTWFKKIATIPIDPRGIIYHTGLWACNTCIKQGRAMVGDYQKQKYSLGGPSYMYVDIGYNCRECGVEFSFSAAEQQFWYEELNFLVDSRPVHCPDCRKKIRTVKNAARRLGVLLHLDRELSRDEFLEMSTIYEKMGSQSKAQIAANRAKKMK